MESTAHTFGVGIVDGKGKIIADEKSVHFPAKGLIPREMAQHHVDNAKQIIEAALKSAKLTFDDIDIFAFSQGPGIPNALRVGASLARYLSLKYSKPLVGVNHCIAHVEISKLTTDAKIPVVLYLSGGNSQIVALVEGIYRVFGETQDIPVGNAFDCLARELRLGMPGGPEIERAAKKGKYIQLPYMVKGMDLSFTGILTDAVKKFKEGKSAEDICYSFQEVCFSMLTEVTERALAHTDKKEVLLTGGVAANKRLQEMLRIMCEERGAKFYVVDNKYSGDCGVMIAWAGLLGYKSGETIEIENSSIKQRWRIDQVKINWS